MDDFIVIEVIFRNGNKYVGEALVNPLKGEMTYSDGSKYVGEF